MRNKNNFNFRILFLIGIIVLFMVSFLSIIQAENFDDPIVSGDFIPIFNDGGENILKNKTEPIQKETPFFYSPISKDYTIQKEKLNNIDIKVKRNLKGKLVELYGKYPTGKDVNNLVDLEKTSKDFLSIHAGFFNLNSSELVFIPMEINKRKNTIVAHFNQYYEDIPVYSGIVNVIITSKGDIYHIYNGFFQNINISIKPTLSKQEALNIIKNENNVNLTENEKFLL